MKSGLDVKPLFLQVDMLSVNMKQYISLPTISKGCSALATIYFLTIRKFSQNIH